MQMHKLFICLLFFVCVASMITTVTSVGVADFSTSVSTLYTTTTMFLNNTYHIFYWAISHCPTNNTVRVFSTSTIVARVPQATTTYSTVTTILSSISSNNLISSSTTTALTSSLLPATTHSNISTSTSKGTASDIGPGLAMAFLGLGLAAVPIGIGLGLGLGKGNSSGRKQTSYYPAYCYPTYCYPAYYCPTYNYPTYPCPGQFCFPYQQYDYCRPC